MHHFIVHGTSQGNNDDFINFSTNIHNYSVEIITVLIIPCVYNIFD